jgi:hypothetical protein
MKRLWTATVVATLLSCNSAFSPAFAQAGGMSSTMPGIAATSPLGLIPGALVPPTGIPLGATELASPGLSPVISGTAGMAGNGTNCSAAGNPTSETSGTSTYDGGGMALSGSGAICGASPSGSTAAMSSTASGNVARPGIPLGSVEIGSAGVSPLLTIPTPTVSPSTMVGTPFPSPPTSATPMMPATTGAPTAQSAISATSQPGLPCGAILPSGLANNC